jgi:hypothetical protein
MTEEPIEHEFDKLISEVKVQIARLTTTQSAV